MKKVRKRISRRPTSSLFCRTLNSEYETRRQANKLFSRRAFSRLLGVPAVTLSYMLDGTRDPSPRTLATIAKALNWPESQRKRIIEDFALGQEERIAEDCRSREPADPNSRLLEDPATMAILALSQVPGASTDPVEIASVLRISEKQARESLKILVEEGVLEIREGRLERLPYRPYFIPSPDSKLANYKSRVIRHLLDLKESRDGIERHSMVFTLSLTPAQLEKVGQRIVAFSRRLREEFPAEPGGEVYYGLFAAYPFVDGVREKDRQQVDFLKPLRRGRSLK